MNSEEFLDSIGLPLLDGLVVTLQVFVGAAVLATFVGLFVGLARLANNRAIRYAATCFVEFFRGTAALVQMFWVFYALPLVLGLPLPPLWAAWIVIGCNQGAYLAEVVRGAVRAVPASQIEAAIAVNLPAATRWRRIIIPQAIPIIIPNYTNHIITVLKETAIVSLIGIYDMTHVANNLRTEFANTTAIFLVIAAMYLAVALIIAWLGRRLEHRVDIYRVPKRGRSATAPSAGSAA